MPECLCFGVVPGHVQAMNARACSMFRTCRGSSVVLHRAELRLGVWVVVGDPGPVVGLCDPEISEVVLQDGGPHRRAGVGVHDVGQPFVGDRVLEHLDGEVVDFAVLDSVADEFAREDVDDRVRLEADTPPRRPQIGDVLCRPADYADIVGVDPSQCGLWGGVVGIVKEM